MSIETNHELYDEVGQVDHRPLQNRKRQKAMKALLSNDRETVLAVETSIIKQQPQIELDFFPKYEKEDKEDNQKEQSKDFAVHSVFKTRVRLSDNFNYHWSYDFELIVNPRPLAYSLQKFWLSGQELSLPQNQDFCLYEVIRIQQKPKMVNSLKKSITKILERGITMKKEGETGSMLSNLFNL